VIALGLARKAHVRKAAITGRLPWVRRRIKATALITTVCSQLQLFVALAQKGAEAVERSRFRDASTK
jgi:hypothetical protein